ncbi:hypothetical protein HDG34_005669 [Paraburkholderia sp. HC6.4b]|uniref:hypothetical protein n=1 Tax=unclassified Paraburkholderia TaxID=2615204 RepID=UPI0016230444|nr:MULTISPECIES: hypothetical protein [unclassified Paraburkholderia]MBB5411708.1 hypothetical protein [Paraburkholderia sp. HC6.4b]MBB5453263.1 hypothetical protein [Paraburkholderia sp. Kb1A]
MSDDVSLTVNGLSIAGWKSVSITRGASRASMQTVSTSVPMPLRVLAIDTLLEQAASIHPAFAPISFTASLT